MDGGARPRGGAEDAGVRPGLGRVLPGDGLPARPIAVAGPRSLVWIFGTPPPGLVDQVAGTGARVVTSTLDPLAQLVQVQRLAVAAAEARGLDPDHPRALTRSVVLA